MGAIPKFNFIPEKQLLSNHDSSSLYKATIYAKPIKEKGSEKIDSYSCNLIFTKDTVLSHDLKDKMIRFYGDREKKTLGWSILKTSEGFSNLEGIKQITLNSGNIATFGISRLLKAIGVEIKENRRDIPVLVYKTPLQSHPVYYIKF